ncbi:phage holin family protein [Cellulomonas sp. C5510]|nr:phage holin family protein [Cellulomonas sp. C5510]
MPRGPAPGAGPPDGTGAGPAPRPEPERPSLGDLIGSVTQDLSRLVRQEVELAKAELGQSARRAGRGSGLLAGAGVAGHFVLLFLSVALWWGLPIGKAWSAVVVAAVWGVVGAVLALRGRAELRRVQGTPRTAETVRKIPNALKGEEEANHE